MTPTMPTPPVPAVPEIGEPVLTVPEWAIPHLDRLVTEDDAPMDNIFTEKQQRLLTEPLYTSWPGPADSRPFLALANVGFFHTYTMPPLAPDLLLSLGVELKGSLRDLENRSYFLWLAGKPPDVVVEIVSDRRGGEEDVKMQTYARWGILYYAIFDPDDVLKGGVLRSYVLDRRRYRPTDAKLFDEVGLGLTLWNGAYEGKTQLWLRWQDANGVLVPTGKERADAEAQRANAAEERTRKLIEQLRRLGVEPEA